MPHEMRWKSGVRDAKDSNVGRLGSTAYNPVKDDQEIESVRDMQSNIRGIVREATPYSYRKKPHAPVP